MDLAEIQHAIEELPNDQQSTLRAWIAERCAAASTAEPDQAEWEAEIERDFSPGGAGGAIIEEMKADACAGKFRTFEEGRPQKH